MTNDEIMKAIEGAKTMAKKKVKLKTELTRDEVPKPVGSDPQALFNPRPQPASVASLILLDNNPFTSIIYSGTTYVNVYSEDHQRKAGDIVRFRGAPQVTAGSGF